MTRPSLTRSERLDQVALNQAFLVVWRIALWRDHESSYEGAPFPPHVVVASRPVLVSARVLLQLVVVFGASRLSSQSLHHISHRMHDAFGNALLAALACTIMAPWSSTGQATPTPALPRSRPCSIKENVLVLRYLIQGNSRGMLLIYPPQTVPKALLNTTVREGVAGVFPEDLAWKGGDAHMIFGLLDANSAHRVGFQTRADHFCFRDRS
jgi:hypothetical protein